MSDNNIPPFILKEYTVMLQQLKLRSDVIKNVTNFDINASTKESAIKYGLDSEITTVKEIQHNCNLYLHEIDKMKTDVENLMMKIDVHTMYQDMTKND